MPPAAAAALHFSALASAEQVAYAEARLRAADLQVTRVPSAHEGAVLRLEATPARLALEAESEELLKPRAARPDELDPFTTAERGDFAAFDAGEEAMLLWRLLQLVEAGPGLDALIPAGASHRGSVRASEGLLHALQRAGLLEAAAPLQDQAARRAVWRQGLWGLASPVAAIKQLYGPEVAMYYAWMNFTTAAYLVPGTLGAALYVLRPAGRSVDNGPLIPFFSLVVVLWAFAYLRLWRRRAAALACEWGTLDVERREHVRPEFWGALVQSRVTGELERSFSYARRVPRYSLSAVVTALMLAVAFSVMVCSLNLQGYIHAGVWGDAYLHFEALEQYSRPGELFDPNGNAVLALVPVVLHSVVILLLNTLYRGIAGWLTDRENHRLETHHEQSLVLKRFLFEAFDCYIALVYLMCDGEILRLRAELVALYTTDSVRRVATESLLPLVLQWTSSPSSSSSKKKDDSAPGDVPVELQQLRQDEYESFDDMLEMVIQYGYVTLFASAFPLAGAVSVGCNLIEARSDLFKITHLCRRPVPRQVKDLGVWETVMTVMVFASVLTNCVIFGFTSEQMMTWLPWLFSHGADGDQVLAQGLGRYVVGLVFGIEHVLVIVGIFIWLAIPAVPEWVDTETRRREYKLLRASREERRERLAAFRSGAGSRSRK